MLKHLFAPTTLASFTCAIVCCAASAQTLKHEKYQLANGMTVILHEDRTLPVATINLWYRVGAKNEPRGRSGFAHLFEHLMFMGTKRVPGSDFDVIMETGGGSNNASTSLDRTNYFSSGPSTLLPTLLWLDADRMEDLGMMMDKSKLDKQRDVVRNELRQTVENRPYGKADEAVYQYMFPEGHPYHFGVIGTHEDLEAASVTNVKDFFATFYVPNNCSLVIAGDFDSKQIKPVVEQLFGTLPRGSTPPQPAYVPQKLNGVKRAAMLDKVQLPRTSFYYHSPATYTDGDAEMQLIGMILADGPSSRLYKRLVLQDELAVNVSANQEGATLGSVFRVEVQAKPGVDLNKVEQIMDEELNKLMTGAIEPSEITQRNRTLELAAVAGLQSIEARADKLNEYEYFFGNPDSLEADLNRYRKATPASLQAWAKKVLTPDARLQLRVLPEAAPRVASPRDSKPEALGTGAFTVPTPEQFKLSSGVPVLLYRNSALPLVSMEMLIKNDSVLDMPNQAGRMNLLGQMLSEGTKSMDSVQFAQAIQGLGASFSAGGGIDSLTVSMTSLKPTFEQAAALWAEAIMSPRMASEDFERVKQNHLEDLKQADEEPRSLAGRIASRALFGDANPYAWPGSGTLTTCSPMTLEQIAQAKGAVLRPEMATILIAGDITPDQAKATLEKVLAGWKGEGTVSAPKADFSINKIDGMKLIIIDRPDSTQTQIHYRAPGFTFASEQRVALRVLNTILGQSFTSRLNQNLREKNGYTYGAGSRMSFGRELGSFSASSSVKADVTGASIKEFMNEFDRLLAKDAGDISADEVVKARKTLRTETIQSFASLGGMVGTAASLLEVGAPLTSTQADLAALDKVNADQLNAMCRQALQLNMGVLVLVGDKKLILDQIKDIKLPKPEFRNTKGEIVNP